MNVMHSGIIDTHMKSRSTPLPLHHHHHAHEDELQVAGCLEEDPISSDGELDEYN